MSTLDQRLRLLAHEPAADARTILVEALRFAREDERGRLCLALAADPHPDALLPLIRMFHRLPAADADALAASIPDLRPAISATLQQDRPQDILNLLDLIARRGDVASARRALPPLMGHDDPELAEQAGAAVLVVTVAAVGPTGRRQVSNARRESLERLVVAALESPLRRRAEAVLVAGGLLMVRPGAVFGDLIE